MQGLTVRSLSYMVAVRMKCLYNLLYSHPSVIFITKCVCNLCTETQVLHYIFRFTIGVKKGSLQGKIMACLGHSLTALVSFLLLYTLRDY